MASAESLELLGELKQQVGGDRSELNAALNGTLEKLKQVTEWNDSGTTARQLARNIRAWRERNTLQSIASMAASRHRRAPRCSSELARASVIAL